MEYPDFPGSASGTSFPTENPDPARGSEKRHRWKGSHVVIDEGIEITLIYRERVRASQELLQRWFDHYEKFIQKKEMEP